MGTPTSEVTSTPQNNIESTLDSTKREYTIVTGLWDLKRNEGLNDGRNFTDHYLTMFDEFLRMPMNLFIYVPKELEEFVRSRRSEKNTLNLLCFEKKLFDNLG